MTSLLVDRLHVHAHFGGTTTDKAKRMDEAADRIELLEDILSQVHGNGYEINEDLEIKIREALGLPLGDED